MPRFGNKYVISQAPKLVQLLYHFELFLHNCRTSNISLYNEAKLSDLPQKEGRNHGEYIPK